VGRIQLERYHHFDVGCASEKPDFYRLRGGSVTSEAAVGMIAGLGVDSNILALDAMVSRLRKTAKG
jgi:3-dehydroquinate dehydratase